MFLTAQKAAEKLGINVAQFHRCVERGEIPPACLNTRPKMWNDSQLDSIGENSSVPISDPLMERILGN